MKFSEQWLREWIDPALDAQALGDQLTLAGLELEGIEPAAAVFDGIVVAEVDAVEPHPDADKLRVCKVNSGTESLQIVCGAANVRAGLKVPLAMIGASLPPKTTDDKPFKIKPAKLRGVASQGMLCAAAELGLEEESNGLWELPADAPVGQDLRDWLQLDDSVIEVDLTPNRGDCLGILGIAREVAALNRMPLPADEVPAVTASIDDSFPIKIEAPEDCPRYLGRVLKGLDASAATPLWMVEKLRRSGIRSLGPLVDVTNYVLLERGQPMHAFDLGKLDTNIVVRRAAAGEQLTLLDDSNIKLDPECLVIADASGPLALAGIMGGKHSGCSTGTTENLLLESAWFKPTTIAGRARRFGLHTDSSHRFERGVDPSGQRAAMERATALLLDICGGEAGEILEVAHAAQLPANPEISVSLAEINRQLGAELAVSAVTDCLTALGMSVQEADSVFTVTPPSARSDIRIAADVVEEVARLVGYDNLPTTDAPTAMKIKALPEATLSVKSLADAFVMRGYHEAITYSFIDPKLQEKIVPDAEQILLSNPIASDMACMRASLWPGLLQSLQYNSNRQQSRLRLFEVGRRFNLVDGSLQQNQTIAGLIAGPTLPEQWNHDSKQSDFFDLKADIDAVLQGQGLRYQWLQPRNEAEIPAALHPGRAALLSAPGGQLGWVGELHPALGKSLGLNQRTVMFEFDLAAMQDIDLPKFNDLAKFPSIRRDIAVIVSEEISAQALCAAVLEAVPDLLQEVFVFDVYRGDDLEAGTKSVALGLILQDFSATLTEERITAIMGDVLESLQRRTQARMRS